MADRIEIDPEPESWWRTIGRGAAGGSLAGAAFAFGKPPLMHAMGAGPEPTWDHIRDQTLWRLPAATGAGIAVEVLRRLIFGPAVRGVDLAREAKTAAENPLTTVAKTLARRSATAGQAAAEFGSRSTRKLRDPFADAAGFFPPTTRSLRPVTDAASDLSPDTLAKLRRYVDAPLRRSEFAEAEAMNPLIRQRLPFALERGEFPESAMNAWRLSRHLQRDFSDAPLVYFGQTPKWYRRAMTDFSDIPTSSLSRLGGRQPLGPMSDIPSLVAGRNRLARRLEQYGAEGVDRLARVQDAALGLGLSPTATRRELMRVMRESTQAQSMLRRFRRRAAMQRIIQNRRARMLERGGEVRNLGRSMAWSGGLGSAALLRQILEER